MLAFLHFMFCFRKAVPFWGQGIRRRAAKGKKGIQTVHGMPFSLKLHIINFLKPHKINFLINCTYY